MQTKKTGLFITFEGLDGSGKSTQMQLCAEALQTNGHEVVITRNPGGTQFGKALREILLHSAEPVFPLSELLLFIADRAQHMDEVVIPAIEQGKIVLCDRHMDSTVAYQGYGRALCIETIQHLNQIAIQGHPPDLTLLFDADPAVLSQRVSVRGKADRMEAEATTFHQKVRDGFVELAQAEPERIHKLDALESVESLHPKVMAIIDKALTQKI